MIEYDARRSYAQNRGIETLTEAKARARHATPPGYVAKSAEDGCDPILLTIAIPGMGLGFLIEKAARA
jgi:hypothetical protein